MFLKLIVFAMLAIAAMYFVTQLILPAFGVFGGEYNWFFKKIDTTVPTGGDLEELDKTVTEAKENYDSAKQQADDMAQKANDIRDKLK